MVVLRSMMELSFEAKCWIEDVNIVEREDEKKWDASSFWARQKGSYNLFLRP